MRLLAVNSARAIWLVKTIRLNPRGRNLLPAMIGLAERYKFSKLPQTNNLAAQPLDLKFESGVFEATDGTPVAVNLSILDDGLIAETRASTDESDRFLADALTWASDEFGLPHYSDLGVEQLYASELTVQLNLSIQVFSEKFLGFAERLRLGVSNNPGLPMEFTALHFGPDPSQTQKVAPFRIERLVNVPFHKKEYYSGAPLTTSEHLELLEMMERFASDTPLLTKSETG